VQQLKVGFVAQLSKGASRAVVSDALKMLARMAHRGACGCEENTGELPAHSPAWHAFPVIWLAWQLQLAVRQPQHTIAAHKVILAHTRQQACSAAAAAAKPTTAAAKPTTTAATSKLAAPAGDGAGMLCAMPDSFFSSVLMDEQSFKLPPLGDYAVGMVSLPVCHL
jgi:glutamate synthase domain-containing protein 1